MKKVANFIINKRFLILLLIGILCVVSVFLIPKVGINKDMTAYLPDDSGMKKGLVIVQQEFPENLSIKQVQVMFKGLPSEDISLVIAKLKSVNGIIDVMYDKTETYNKDGYTLFILMTEINFNTPEEKALEKEIAENFIDYPIVIQHMDSYTSTIPTLILIIAIAVLSVILFVMCSSWLDPILFLFTIGIAVLLNFGSNYFLKTISETTFSMSAILQLVLSMDYSIILMNRYRQEKLNTTDNIEAMKNAFANSFSSILGSGLTTILGLLVLCFMSFKIGADLGIVMAKGVLLSMICVMTVLPTLILLTDKLLEKTKKKTINFKMTKVAKYENKHHFALTIAFVVVCVSAFYLQNSTRISFSPVKNDEIGKIFTPSNQTIVVYETKDEEKITNVITQLTNKDQVKTILGYGNTLGANLTTKEMLEAFSSFGSDISIDESLLKILYYDYYKGSSYPPVTINEFYKILTEQLMKEENFKDYFDDAIIEQIERLSPFVNKKNLTKEQTVKSLSEIFSLDREEVAMLLGMYYAEDESYLVPGMKLPELVFLLKNDILNNPIFSQSIPEEMKNQFGLLEKLTNKDFIQVQLTSDELARQLGIDPSLMKQIYNLKFGLIAAIGAKMSICDFATFMVTEVIDNESYKDLITEEQKSLVRMMKVITDGVMTDKVFSDSEVAEFVPASIDKVEAKKIIKMLFIYNNLKNNSSSKAPSIKNIISFINKEILPNPKFANLFPADKKVLISLMDKITDAVIQNTVFTSSELYSLLQPLSSLFSKDMLDLFYLYNGAINYYNPNWTMSIDSMLNHVIKNIVPDDKFNSFINQEIIDLLTSAHKMIEDNKKRLVGKDHSLLLIELNLPAEGEETTRFFDSLDEMLKNNLDGEYHFVGESAMSVEMEHGFRHDLMLISILTALVIFIVILLTFRSVIIPFVLVLIVQCGVFITIFLSGLISNSIYFLALLIVQCILMGATVDYGIVYTNYYIENRKTMSITDSLQKAYEKSLHTILTSSLIIILVTGFIGLSPTDPAIAAICITLSLGTISAVLLIMFILPALLALFDKKLMKKKIHFVLSIEDIAENKANVKEDEGAN